MNRRTLSPERRLVVILSSMIAAMSGVMAVLAKDHPQVVWAWLGFLVIAFILIGMKLVKIRHNERSNKGPQA